MSVPPEHQRVLPNVAVSEQGLRELELWLMDRIRALVKGLDTGLVGILYNFNNVGPVSGSWLSIVTTAGSDPALGHPNNPGLALIIGDGEDNGAGDFYLVTGRDWNINDIGRDCNFEVLRDINMNAGEDLNSIHGRDYNLQTGNDFQVDTGRNFDVTTAGTTSFKIATAGETYVIKDHLGSPLVTYTG